MDNTLNDELIELRKKLGTNFVKGIDEVGNNQGLKSYLEGWIKYYEYEEDKAEEEIKNPSIVKSVKNKTIEDLKRYIQIIKKQEID